jgi:hypothetical protein
MEKLLLLLLAVVVAISADDIVEDASLDTVSWWKDERRSENHLKFIRSDCCASTATQLRTTK